MVDFLYDGDALVGEYNGATILRRYLPGAGIDEPLMWYEGSGFTSERWLLADELGSIVATSYDGGSGDALAYGAFGEPDNWTGSHFLYTDQIALYEARLYHYKNRVYDPSLGRFLQTDPIGHEAGGVCGVI